jgi:hypothetical protein
MNRDQLEKAYIANGLPDFELRNLNDLLKVHGIDYRVKGYENLTAENSELYMNWLIMFFNRQGLGTRLNLVPTRVFFCEEVCHARLYEHEGEKFLETTKTELFELHADGKKKLVRTYKTKDFNNLMIVSKEQSKYLRVEFKKKEWYHVYSVERWG